VPFKKVGAIFKIAESTTLDSPKQWTEFKTNIAKTEEAAINKDADFSVIADVDLDKFIYIHSTIMAGVKTGSNGYWITKDTEKYANDNHDAWTCDDLKNDYKSFKQAMTFVEHVQDLEKAKGKCIDVIARQLPDTILVDVLFSVSKKHEDLVDNINNRIINAVSMGCSTEKTICAVCGNVAKVPEEYCDHIKQMNKGRMYKCADGETRRAVEICKNNSFFDISLVANPAFSGAVFRKILASVSDVSNQLLANIITNKIQGYTLANDTFLKAANEKDNVEFKLTNGILTIKTAGKEITSDEKLSDVELEQFKRIAEVCSDGKCHLSIGNDCNKITINTEKKGFKLLNTIKKFFNKDATHPIENISTHLHDYKIDYENYAELPFINPNQTAEFFLEQNPRVPEKVSLLEKFCCYNCGYENDLWQVKAASIDSGSRHAFICPNCSFVSEINFKNAKVEKKSITSIDKLQMKDLGFEDISSLSPQQVEIILLKGITKDEFDKNPNVFLLKGSLIKRVREGVFTASKDIPVTIRNGSLISDPKGKTIIAKGEVLNFFAFTADEKNVVLKTEDHESFYVPLDKNATGAIGLIKRPNESSADSSRHETNRHPDTPSRSSLDSGKDKYQDKRSPEGNPERDSNVFEKTDKKPIKELEVVE
jgi:hypothetical protein